MSGRAAFSSSSFTRAFAYDVILSYRSSDTRYGFTGILYKALWDKGIHTFSDAKEFRTVDEIGPSLDKAIQQSRIGIIIFSKNYAFSSYCLDELVKLIQCSEEYYQLVLSVFYNVDRSDVFHQEGTYGEALATHEEKFKKKVHEWRMALQQAASLSGWHFRDGDGDEHKFIGKIVKEVSDKIKRVPLHVADHPVGLEPRVREVCSLLDAGTDDGICMIGIYGMGGIGKTTLARAVFNVTADRFECLCYVDNVRENSMKHGLVHLQERLLSEITGEKNIWLRNVNEGISIIKRMLQHKRVLLILDEVDKLEQLQALVGESNWFGRGSKVIITTRDRHLLVIHGIERIYRVEVLNHKDALELFTWNAFKHGKVSPSYMEFFNQAVTYASGLPFALEVIGSILFGKSVEEWIRALNVYTRNLSNKIKMRLQVSYDALKEEEKSVFLDIACCFKGYELTKLEDILCAHYGNHMKQHIRILDEKSLLSISSDGVVTLHPLIEEMGKNIVRQESLEPGRRSRLWFSEDIIHVLQKNTGTSKIEIINWDFSLLEEEVEWDGMAFNKMKNLSTLIIRNGNFSRGPNHLPDSLRVLEWWRYPSTDLPSDFHPERLAKFELPDTHNVSPKLAKLLKISQRVTEISQTVPEVLQTSKREVPEVSHSDPEVLQTPKSTLQSETIWTLIGLASSVVGLLCLALSRPFHRLIRGWNTVKSFLYGLFSVIICVTVLCARRSSFSRQNVQLKPYLGFAVLMMTCVYSYFYDKAMDGKPDILSLVSNAAFALLSLCLSKLIRFGFEMSMFCFFISWFTIQLVTIDLKLILVAIIFGFPLFIMHFSSDFQSENSNPQGQDIHSSSNSRQLIGTQGQQVRDS